MGACCAAQEAKHASESNEVQAIRSSLRKLCRAPNYEAFWKLAAELEARKLPELLVDIDPYDGLSPLSRILTHNIAAQRVQTQVKDRGGTSNIVSELVRSHKADCSVLVGPNNDSLLAAIVTTRNEHACKIFRDLCAHGCDVNARDRAGKSALHKLAEVDDENDSQIVGEIEKKVMCLISCSASVDVADADGNTPLHVAASLCHSDTCRVLLHCGASLQAVNKVGLTPTQIATRRGGIMTESKLSTVDPRENEYCDDFDKRYSKYRRRLQQKAQALSLFLQYTAGLNHDGQLPGVRCDACRAAQQWHDQYVTVNPFHRAHDISSEISSLTATTTQSNRPARLEIDKAQLHSAVVIQEELSPAAEPALPGTVQTV